MSADPASWRNPVLRHWATLFAVSIVFVVTASVRGLLWRADLAIYDAALPTGPAPADVTIVAIDDRSVAALGRWPWRREIHAALLDRLRRAGATAVGLDIAFTEPDPTSAQGDLALAAALSRGLPVVLPLLVEMPTRNEPLRERLPIPALAGAAAGLGHAQIELDRDGVARSLYLREGIGSPNRSYFALSVLNSVPGTAATLPRGVRHPDLAASPRVWVRDYHMWIPFLGPPGHFHTLSYVDVLRGAVPDSRLKGQWILVGATAQGLGDAYPTALSGSGVAMSGVEITANVLQGLRSAVTIQPVHWPVAMLLSLAPIAAAFAMFLRLSPRATLRLMALLWVGTLALSVALLRLGFWWWSPATTLTTLTVLYPVWSWRRLAAAQGFLEEEFARFNSERSSLFETPTSAAAGRGAVDTIQRRIQLVRDATQRLRDVRQLLGRAIRDLPDAVILADLQARILIANEAAALLFGVAAAENLEGTSVDDALYARTQSEPLRFAAVSAAAPCTREARLEASGPDVLVRAVPFDAGPGKPIGTLICITDVSAVRAAQRERDEMVRFLSHDMKSPAHSLIGLAQLQRDPARALSAGELSRRLDVVAHRLLDLVDGFMALARAESADPRAFEHFDLRDSIQDAADEVWATAHAQQIAVAIRAPDEALLVNGDRHALARAIVNLLSNAIKFSPAGSTVQLDCAIRDSQAVVTVTDRGPGIPTARRSELFERFSRRLHRGDSDPGGSGLGLVFVRVVAQKHRGRAWHDAESAAGAQFCLALPLAAATARSG